jgi:hypothetical protein
MQAPQSWVDESTSFWTYSPAHHLRLGPDLRVNVSERRSARSALQLTSWKWPSTTWRCTTFFVDFLVVAASTAVRASGWIDCLGSRARMMLVRVHCQMGAGEFGSRVHSLRPGQARPGQARPCVPVALRRVRIGPPQRNSHDSSAIAESEFTVIGGSMQELVDAKVGGQPKAMTPMTPARTRALAAYSLRS